MQVRILFSEVYAKPVAVDLQGMPPLEPSYSTSPWGLPLGSQLRVATVPPAAAAAVAPNTSQLLITNGGILQNWRGGGVEWGWSRGCQRAERINEDSGQSESIKALWGAESAMIGGGSVTPG